VGVGCRRTSRPNTRRACRVGCTPRRRHGSDQHDGVVVLARRRAPRVRPGAVRAVAPPRLAAGDVRARGPSSPSAPRCWCRPRAAPGRFPRVSLSRTRVRARVERRRRGLAARVGPAGVTARRARRRGRRGTIARASARRCC
jgi:hypothetical protein